MMSFALYECTSVADNKHLCSIGFKFTETRSHQSHFGRIETALFFTNPESNSRERQINTQTWYKSPQGEYHMGITRFSLPPFLQGTGTGTVIWSEIFKGLPERIQGRLRISGSLNSGDAFTPQTDSDGKIIYKITDGIRKIKRLNQIERRNRFWRKMLLPFEENTPALTCDQRGNGAFKGFFKDPLSAVSSGKVKLEPIKTKNTKCSVSTAA